MLRRAPCVRRFRVVNFAYPMCVVVVGDALYTFPWRMSFMFLWIVSRVWRMRAALLSGCALSVRVADLCDASRVGQLWAPSAFREFVAFNPGGVKG